MTEDSWKSKIFKPKNALRVNILQTKLELEFLGGNFWFLTFVYNFCKLSSISVLIRNYILNMGMAKSGYSAWFPIDDK